MKGKKIITFFLLFCLLVASISVRAEEIGEVVEVVDGSKLTNDQEVSGSTLANAGARGTYLGTGSAKLSNNGNHVLNVWGNTTCNRTCDQVKVTLHLQRLVNGTWTTVMTLDTKIAYNTNYVSNSKNVTVTGGYYYRISGTHVAIKGSTTESTYSSTDGMWVSK